MEEGAYHDEPPPPQASSSHFPLEPISGATLFGVEVARREQLHRRGALATGCGEIDRQVLGGGRGGRGGFERGSVVGISAEGMDTGLLIGLQTIAHSLLASLVCPGPGTRTATATATATATEQKQHGARQQQPPNSQPALLRAAVITTLPAPTILPHLRDVIKVQVRLKLGGQAPAEVVDATTRQCLQQISVSRVFDIEGLWEVLSELESAAVAEPTMAPLKEDEEEKPETGAAVPAPDDLALPESSQRSPPSPSPSLPVPPPPATKLPPLRMRTEVQDSDEEEDVLLSSSPLSSLRSTPKLSPEAMDELAALSRPAVPSRQLSSPPALPETMDEPKALSPPAAPSRQQSPSPPLPPREQEAPTAASAPGLPDIILITHTSSLFSTVFTARDKTSAHTTLQLLSSHLRYLSRSAGPLVLLLNITSSSSSSSSSTTTNPAQPPVPRRPESEQQPPRPLDPTLRSIFNPPPPSHLGYAATMAHALSRKNKPAFGQTFAQFLDLHLLCTKVPRSREDAEVLFSSTTTTAEGIIRQQQQQQQRPVRYAWVIETLVDELGAWEWVDDTTATATEDNKDSKGGGKKMDDKKWKMVDREQRWGAVEIRAAGCHVVDAFDSTRIMGRMNGEPIRLAAGFGGRRD